MKIKVINRKSSIPTNVPDRIILVRDDWDDFGFKTLFKLIYIDIDKNIQSIEYVNIGFYGQKEIDIVLSGITELETLGKNYFSLGQGENYYTRLNELGEIKRNEILKGLNDIAKNPSIYEKAILENVTKVSFLRNLRSSIITSQYRRIANGGARLTSYKFSYEAQTNDLNYQLDFEVYPESYPPTNIHVIIGSNGVGKTFLLKNIFNASLRQNGSNHGNIRFNEANEVEFTHTIFISFSAFDDLNLDFSNGNNLYSCEPDSSYIGLIKLSDDGTNLITKNSEDLDLEFTKTIEYVQKFKKKSWKRCFEILEKEPYFKNMGLYEMIADSNSDRIFKNFSSGQKIILLSLVKIMEKIQEKTLILIDEPESHLHPPLLSAYIRAISSLLIRFNGVAIVATHSPVVLQEIPQKCVWKLTRIGKEAKAERLGIQSFGENVGVLTNEVFGLEVTNSGFYKLLKDVVNQTNEYDEAVNHFDGQLGMEAKAILRMLFLEK